jgi:hypothetical protein
VGDLVCISNETARRARAAVDCVYALAPDATPRRKEMLASKILSMCFDERHGFTHGITEDQMKYLVEPEMLRDYYGRTGSFPLIVWWSRVAQAVRMFYREKVGRESKNRKTDKEEQ